MGEPSSWINPHIAVASIKWLIVATPVIYIKELLTDIQMVWLQEALLLQWHLWQSCSCLIRRSAFGALAARLQGSFCSVYEWLHVTRPPWYDPTEFLWFQPLMSPCQREWSHFLGLCGYTDNLKLGGLDNYSSFVYICSSTVRALNKNFSIAFLFPVFISLLFFQHNRTVYDIVAGTIVVQRRGGWKVVPRFTDSLTAIVLFLIRFQIIYFEMVILLNWKEWWVITSSNISWAVL